MQPWEAASHRNELLVSAVEIRAERREFLRAIREHWTDLVVTADAFLFETSVALFVAVVDQRHTGHGKQHSCRQHGLVGPYLRRNA